MAGSVGVQWQGHLLIPLFTVSQRDSTLKLQASNEACQNFFWFCPGGDACGMCRMQSNVAMQLVSGTLLMAAPMIMLLQSMILLRRHCQVAGFSRPATIIMVTTAVMATVYQHLADPSFVVNTPAIIQGVPCPKSAWSMVPALQLVDMAAQSLKGTKPGAARTFFQYWLSSMLSASPKALEMNLGSARMLCVAA